MIRVAFDSNVLIYLSGGERVAGDRPKVTDIRRLVVEFAARAVMVAPVQSMGEALQVLARKFGMTPAELAAEISYWEGNFTAVETSIDVLRDAVALAAAHRLQHWDAVIVAAAVAGGCDILLSEDMQHGFAWRGLTIVNPFVDPPHPLLRSLL